jgi:alkaline phosphatase D
MKRIPLLLIAAALFACNSERVAVDATTDVSAPGDGSTTDPDTAVPDETGQGGDADESPDLSTIDAEDDLGEDAPPEADVEDDTEAPDTAADDADEVEDVDADAVDVPDTEDVDGTDDEVAADVEEDSVTDTDAAIDAGDGAEPWPVDPVAVPESVEVFPLSVQAGAMQTSSALLWTFVSDAQPVELRVWRDGEAGERLLALEATVSPDAAGYLHVRAEGLQAGTWYQYAFFRSAESGELQQRSPVGRFSTAWAPGVRAPLTVAATSCTNQRFRPLDAVERMAESGDISVFLHTGDQHYNDGYETLDEFRNGWRSQLNERAYRRMHETVGLYQTWDDHEVDNDYDPTSMSRSILNAAFQAYFESFAVERGPGDGIWTSYVWGDTAEFIILDSRSERYVPDDSYYMSQAQLDWFLDRLSNSTAHFKVVLNSVPITDMPGGYFGEGDRWEGFDRQRDAVINHITSNDIRNVWFVSGDFHIGMVTRINNDGPGRRIHEIAAGPGGNTNPAASTLGALEFFSGVDQQIYNTGSFDTEVQTFLTFDPDRNQVRIQFIEATGEVLYDEWLSEGS